VTYEGTAHLDNPYALIDWRIVGGFRVTGGAVLTKSAINAVGIPTGGGTYSLNGTPYTTSQLTTLNAEASFGNSVSPYLGVGWGNVIGPKASKGHWSFVADVGVIYTGTPRINVTATCTTASAALCASPQLQTNLAAEQTSLLSGLTTLKWYPVVSIGIGYRF